MRLVGRLQEQSKQMFELQERKVSTSLSKWQHRVCLYLVIFLQRSSFLLQIWCFVYAAKRKSFIGRDKELWLKEPEVAPAIPLPRLDS